MVNMSDALNVIDVITDKVIYHILSPTDVIDIIAFIACKFDQIRTADNSEINKEEVVFIAIIKRPEFHATPPSEVKELLKSIPINYHILLHLTNIVIRSCQDLVLYQNDLEMFENFRKALASRLTYHQLQKTDVHAVVSTKTVTTALNIALTNTNLADGRNQKINQRIKAMVTQIDNLTPTQRKVFCEGTVPLLCSIRSYRIGQKGDKFNQFVSNINKLETVLTEAMKITTKPLGGK
jgi:hypothetical protein